MNNSGSPIGVILTPGVTIDDFIPASEEVFGQQALNMMHGDIQLIETPGENQTYRTVVVHKGRALLTYNGMPDIGADHKAIDAFYSAHYPDHKFYQHDEIWKSQERLGHDA